MKHAPIPPRRTRPDSIPAGLLFDARHTADALSGLPVANFGIAQAMSLLERFNPEQIGDAIEVLVALLDISAGDPDLEQTREDDEEDDPAGQCDEDGVNTRCPGGVVPAPDDLECGLTPDWGIDQTMPLPEAIVLAADREGMQAHRDRIRATRCVPEYQWVWRTRRLEPSTSDFQLIDEPTAPTQRQLLRRKRGVPRRPRG